MSESRQYKPGVIALVTILLSSMVILMGAAAVAPALDPISKHFPDAGPLMISLIISLPSLSVAITGFAMGYLADRFGKVKVFFLALVIFTLAGVSGFFLGSLEAILVGRFILGVGITGISLTTTALIGEYWFGADRAKVIGYQSAAIGVGTLVLETMGGVLAEISWNSPFLIYLIGVPIIILGLISIREPKKDHAAMDDAVSDAGPKNGRGIVLCYLVVFTEMFLMFSMPTNFSYFMMEIGQDLTMCGLLLGVMGVCQAIFSLIYARSSNKLSEVSAYAIAFLMMGVGLALLNINNMAAIWASMVLTGFSLGLLMPTVISQLSMYSTPKTSGKVMGGYSVFLNLSTFVSGVVITAIYGILGSYRDIYLILGILSCVLFVVFILARSIRGKRVNSSIEKTIEKRTPVVKTTAAIPDVQMYRDILVPTDGSDNSNYAVNNAVNIARKNNASVTALYVFESDRYSGMMGNMYSAEKVLEIGESLSKEALEFVVKACEENGVPVRTKVVSGHPAEVIVAESKQHDLVVCGSLGRTNIPRALLGSVAEKVARMAYCPVLIVRKNMDRE